ncbi:hypothetical protein ACP4OV_022769 [Aristida adscensionis]
MESEASNFHVQVLESSLIAPSSPTPRKGLWLSSLDIVQAKKGHVPLIYLYSPPKDAAAAADGFFDVARLKAAMAQALVAFYPLAGRLAVNGGDGRVEIDCNDEGALFVVARADKLTADDVKGFKPSPELRRLFVPRIQPASIILAIQVTFLKCGGVVLGTALHHTTVDATSTFHFIQTWSAFSKHGDHAAAVVELPCHDRTLLRARSPPRVDPDALSTLYTRQVVTDPSGPISTEVFAISGGQVASLKRLCGGGTTSTFCAVSALVWQCACLARRLPPDSPVRLMFPADFRSRARPPLPSKYFGNAVFSLRATGVAGAIGAMALGAIATRIKDTVKRMDEDEELVRSAIDYFETAAAKVDDSSRPSWTGVTLPLTDLSITSWLGRPQYDADFGWGKPELMSRAESRGGFVLLWSNEGKAGGGGDSDDAVRVLVGMEAVNIKELGRLIYAKLEQVAACGGAPAASKDVRLQTRL